MDDSEDPGARRALRPPAPTMEELRARFGRALRDQNFWSLMEELEADAPPVEPPPEVVAFPTERAHDVAPSPGSERPGRLIAIRFPKR